MKKAHKSIGLLLTMFLLIASLAGCGGTKGTGDSAKGPAKVRVQLKWLPSAQFMGFYYAKEKGYYAAEGLDVELINGGPDLVSTNQVSVGAAEFGIANLYSVLPFIEKGHPVVEIGQIFQKSSFLLVSKKEKGINSPQDLAGKKVGAWLGSAEFPVYALLDKYGIDKDKDLTIVKQDNTMDALLNGSLDAASAHTYNEYLVLLKAGLRPEDINVIDLEQEGSGMLEDCLIVNSEWLAENKDIAVKFMRATMKGWAEACKDPEAATEIVWKYLDAASNNKEHQLNFAKEIAKLVAPSGANAAQMLYLDEAQIKATQDLALKYKVIKKVPDKVYDKQLWEEAAKSLQ
ncbi:NitT/TauT family transport system substrate-binding protein [Dendrosporobacter quercicolus]|uniref:Thiamine pyrimidine synthase n=1 Tax=Dendrosporobacter quercicolus TaxID=146817 RepID=A0A1G9RXZ2_9FIRM|nr:ABC transporter substrate-binding protein [Dendrosporobacter quercicolus]SDM27365.1 NitT/TauT family transport system substrate-binding protein [Dendrosporobacter quercicolus]